MGITPLDKRKTGADATKFSRPGMGMYYGATKPHGGENNISRATATKKAYQEMNKGSATGLRK